ncbi:hypothetical protein KAR91_08905 [Candidatus Pacearchaeota archaeon]|nr:hypothetical protein [Candidatus Pacearchaeota archaeon]
MNKDIELAYIQIDIANLPEHQERTYKFAPTKKARHLAKEVVSYILNSRTILPTRVAATIEGGIYLAYTHDDLEMKVEVYNDLNITAILIDNSTEVIMDSLDIRSISDVQRLINPLLFNEY